MKDNIDFQNQLKKMEGKKKKDELQQEFAKQKIDEFRHISEKASEIYQKNRQMMIENRIRQQATKQNTFQARAQKEPKQS